MSLSVLILTLNEEANLPACLQSAAGCDDIVVLDSFSTDRTAAIAASFGARVVQRQFDDFAGQRNYALDQIEFRHDWVFHLDADERLTPELADECRDVIRRDKHSGYMVAGKTMFMDRWLKWSATYPVYQMRLMKRGEVRFVQVGHGQREGESRRGTGALRQPYLHYPFSKGLEEWRARHERYAEQEAQQAARDIRVGTGDPAGLLVRDPVRRRRALKQLSYRVPFRSALRFLYMYVLRLGFLDGRPGFVYCRLLASYEGLVARRLKWLLRGT